MKQGDIDAVKQSIAHWERMIQWAMKQPGDAEVLRYIMCKQIGETWNASDCALCRIHLREPGFVVCGNCPVANAGFQCLEFGSPWSQVNLSKTWKQWLKEAKVMLKTLQSIDRNGRSMERVK